MHDRFAFLSAVAARMFIRAAMVSFLSPNSHGRAALTVFRVPEPGRAHPARSKGAVYPFSLSSGNR